MRCDAHLYEQLVESLQGGDTNHLAAVSREQQHAVVEWLPEHIATNSSCKGCSPEEGKEEEE